MGEIRFENEAGAITGDVADILQAVRAMMPQLVADGIVWHPMRTVDGYEAYVNGVLRGEVRFRTDAEMVTGGIYEWSCHDPVSKGWTSGWCRDLHWGMCVVEKTVRGWLPQRKEDEKADDQIV